MTERFDINVDKFEKMANYFYTNGYVIIENALSPDIVSALKKDLYDAQNTIDIKRNKNSKKHDVIKRFFEHSRTTVDVIENSKLSDFAQYVISDVPGNREGSNSLTAHVIHNNAFSVPPNGSGQASSWHVDDPLQQIILPVGYTLPANIRLPVLVCTYMIWLSDCLSPDNGPTYVVPGSHRYGKPINVVEANRKGIPMCGKAGTAVLINANVWHRGCENKSLISRDTLQITFARRIIGHKHGTIMNYVMPSHVYEGRSEKLKERLGFLKGGAYS